MKKNELVISENQINKISNSNDWYNECTYSFSDISNKINYIKIELVKSKLIFISLITF